MSHTTRAIRTKGISPKVLAPIVTSLGAVITTWIISSEINRPELAVLATAVLTAIAGYLAPVGEVEVPDLEALPYDAGAIDDEGNDGETAAAA